MTQFNLVLLTQTSLLIYLFKVIKNEFFFNYKYDIVNKLTV